MIVGLTIRNFKGIRELASLPLARFHVLVGPNGVGKTTFLDAVDFVRDCPFVVQQCGVEPLLCFSRDDNGAHVIPGSEHPILQAWDGTPDLGVVFAAGILE